MLSHHKRKYPKQNDIDTKIARPRCSSAPGLEKFTGYSSSYFLCLYNVFKTSDVESGLFSPIFLRKFENLNNSPTTDKNNSGFGITFSKMKVCFEVKNNALAYIIYCVTYRIHDMNCCVTIVHS